MPKDFIYKIIPKERVLELNSGDLPENSVSGALKSGEFNHAILEDFRLTIWSAENVHIKNFIWNRGKYRGKFTNCIFSDGKISEVDFWDSDFKNVIFRNVEFYNSEINSFYSDKYIFELNNVIFENCTFHEFTIGQAFNSNVYMRSCEIIDSNFYLKSSCIDFHKCSTKNKKISSSIRVLILSPSSLEPIKIKDCLFFSLKLDGDLIEYINVSAEHFRFRWKNNIKSLVIYCKIFILDSRGNSRLSEAIVKKDFFCGYSPSKILDRLEIICSKYGAFNFYNLKMNTAKISVVEKKADAISSIWFSHINELFISGIKSNKMLFTTSVIQKTNILCCYWNEFSCNEVVFADLSLNSFKLSKKIILNKTKITHLILERISVDKKSEWETESSIIGMLDKPESNQKEIKNVSGHRLLSYFDRADVSVLK